MDYDEDEFVGMAVANLEETMPGEPYSRDRLKQTFANSLARAHPTIWVVEKDRKVIGFMMSYILAFDYRDGHYTTQRVIYVKPECRGTRAAAILAKELVRWSKALGAAKIKGGNDNNFRSERTAGFLEHFGFKRVGFVMTNVLEDSGNGQG